MNIIMMGGRDLDLPVNPDSDLQANQNLELTANPQLHLQAILNTTKSER